MDSTLWALVVALVEVVRDRDALRLRLADLERELASIKDADRLTEVTLGPPDF